MLRYNEILLSGLFLRRSVATGVKEIYTLLMLRVVHGRVILYFGKIRRVSALAIRS